ncbi:Hypothetical predicted protein [Podarcis lilfordi]|uniref:Uncharacterized protein n=1 Tax=Podarcis lilfordi TaxID=74358 RepID=A0AA35PD05_9SAUR|nr:Hypothetical predicted protein [Podarcis lilfordi]
MFQNTRVLHQEICSAYRFVQFQQQASLIGTVISVEIQPVQRCERNCYGCDKSKENAVVKTLPAAVGFKGASQNGQIS